MQGARRLRKIRGDARLTYFAYHITDAPDTTDAMAIREFLGRLRVPSSLTNSPAQLLEFARARFKSIKNLCLSSRRLPKKVRGADGWKTQGKFGSFDD